MRGGKVAILVPTYQGGELLADTLASAAKAGLPPDFYEFVVSDNASTDGSIERAVKTDAQGVPITVLRNQTNIGRVENWNRLTQAAEDMGFGYATYLMVGDLIHGSGFVALRNAMDAAGASLGMAYYHVVDEQLKFIYAARRIHWRVPATGIAPEPLLLQSTAVGAFIHGQLSANIYRLKGTARLRFDPQNPSHTDHRATTTFVHQSGCPVVYLDQPVSCWRRRAGRFHASLDHLQRGRTDLLMVADACHEGGIAPDWRKVRAALILRTLFHADYSISAAWPVLREVGLSPTRVSWPWMARLLVNKLLYRTPWTISAA